MQLAPPRQPAPPVPARPPENVKLASDQINKLVIASRWPSAARRHIWCAGSSVIPGCGVFTTLGGIAGYGESRGLFGS